MSVWWWPNDFDSPKLVRVDDNYRLIDREGDYPAFTKINFFASTRGGAIELHLNHCIERMNFFANKAADIRKYYDN